MEFTFGFFYIPSSLLLWSGSRDKKVRLSKILWYPNWKFSIGASFFLSGSLLPLNFQGPMIYAYSPLQMLNTCYVTAHKHLLIPTPRGSDALVYPLQASACTWYTYAHTHKTNKAFKRDRRLENRHWQMSGVKKGESQENRLPVTWLSVCHSFHENQSYWPLTSDVAEAES